MKKLFFAILFVIAGVSASYAQHPGDRDTTHRGPGHGDHGPMPGGPKDHGPMPGDSLDHGGPRPDSLDHKGGPMPGDSLDHGGPRPGDSLHHKDGGPMPGDSLHGKGDNGPGNGPGKGPGDDSVHHSDHKPDSTGLRKHGNPTPPEGGGPSVWGYFVKNDTCRAALEAQMSAEDVAALEQALATLAAGRNLNDSLHRLLKNARADKDTALMHSINDQLRAMGKQVNDANKTMMDLAKKYAAQIKAVMTDCGGKRPDDKGGDKGHPHIISVKPIHPNPVRLSSAGVTLDYELTASAMVNVTVSDAAGATVQTPVNAQQDAGSYTVTINVAGMKAGVYLVRVQAGAEVTTQKLIIAQ